MYIPLGCTVLKKIYSMEEAKRQNRKGTKGLYVPYHRRLGCIGDHLHMTKQAYLRIIRIEQYEFPMLEIITESALLKFESTPFLSVMRLM